MSAWHRLWPVFWDEGEVEMEAMQGQMIQELQGLLKSVDLSSYIWKPQKECKQNSNLIPFLF